MDSQICKTSGKGWATTRARVFLGYNSMTTALTMVSIFFPDVRFSRSEPGQPTTTLEWCLELAGRFVVVRELSKPEMFCCCCCLSAQRGD